MSSATTTAGGVTLTPAAADMVRKLIAKQGRSDLVLRLGVMGGGCSGLQYVLRLEEESEVDPKFDHLFDAEGVRVAIDRKSMLYLAGTVLDFDTNDLMQGGFVFRNPNAKRGCGCGSSFQA